jgi:hypothetical protein
MFQPDPFRSSRGIVPSGPRVSRAAHALGKRLVLEIREAEPQRLRAAGCERWATSRGRRGSSTSGAQALLHWGSVLARLNPCPSFSVFFRNL